MFFFNSIKVKEEDKAGEGFIIGYKLILIISNYRGYKYILGATLE
jgi:hypothetical protein